MKEIKLIKLIKLMKLMGQFNPCLKAEDFLPDRLNHKSKINT